jgi:hypothetical protein
MWHVDIYTTNLDKIDKRERSLVTYGLTLALVRED